MSQCSSFSVSVSQSVFVRVREEDTFICLSLTITPLLSITKEYLKSLGNSECSPQTFLENSGSLDKLLIIIQNEDIAAHVHKVRGISPNPLHVSHCLSSPVSISHDSASADPGIDQTQIMALIGFIVLCFYLIQWLDYFAQYIKFHLCENKNLFTLQIPALVSLKKLPSVSFAGVDTLDDVKNHTYNELFVSGGFIVSDEFVLNPDLITQGEFCFSL